MIFARCRAKEWSIFLKVFVLTYSYGQTWPVSQMQSVPTAKEWADCMSATSVTTCNTRELCKYRIVRVCQRERALLLLCDSISILDSIPLLSLPHLSLLFLLFRMLMRDLCDTPRVCHNLRRKVSKQNIKRLHGCLYLMN